MDPITVISAVSSIGKAVFSLSTTLYTFVNDTRNVDQSVKDLAAEVASLSTALGQVEVVMKTLVVPNQDDDPDANQDDIYQLAQAVYGALMDCQRTVSRIESVLETVMKDRSNWATQALRQMKINFKKDEMISLRQQIHTHYTALNMALELVNIRAAYTGIEGVNALGSRIDVLQKSMDLLAESLRKQTSRVPSSSKKLNFKETEKLEHLAGRYIRKARTIYSETIAGGSVTGDVLHPDVRARTLNWIPVANSDHGTTRSGTTIYSSTPGRTIFSEHNQRATTDSTKHSDYDSYSVKPSEDHSGSDSEAEFDFDVVQRQIKKGTENFDSANYQDASEILQKCMTTANRFSTRRKEKLNLGEVSMMIALCKFHLKELDEAKKDLLILVRQQSTSESDAIRMCLVSHMLSHVDFLQCQFEDAEVHCRNAVKGRRRLLGAEHTDYYSSLGLLSAICRATGRDQEAGLYQEMIPPAIQLTQKEFEFLSVEWRLLCGYDTGVYRVTGLMGGVVEDQKRQISTLDTIAISLDGELAANKTGSILQLRQVDTGRLRWSNDAQSGSIETATFSSSCEFLATVSKLGIKVWDVKTGVVQREVQGEYSTTPVVAFSPVNNLIVIGANDDTVKLWDWKTKSETQMFSTDSNLTVSGSANEIKLWNFDMDREGVLAVAFSPNGHLILSGSSDSSVMLWNCRKRTGIHRFEEHHGAVQAVAFSPNGQLMASASSDKTVRIWSVDTRAKHLTLIQHSKLPGVLTFSPDSKFLAYGSNDHGINLWDVKTENSQYFSFSGLPKLHALVFHRALVFPPRNQPAASTRDDRVELPQIRPKAKTNGGMSGLWLLVAVLLAWLIKIKMF